MKNEDLEQQITRYRTTARTMGEAALDAIDRGDVGLARTNARQAAQYARIAIQLETGQKQVEPDEEGATLWVV